MMQSSRPQQEFRVDRQRIPELILFRIVAEENPGGLVPGRF